MNVYEVFPAAAGGPQWESLPKAPISNVQWLEAEGIQAWAQLCYDEKNLYVRLEAEEEHILKRYRGENDPVCMDSCLEFFFSAQEKGNRYFNVEINPYGACYVGFGRLRRQRCRLIHPRMKKLLKIRTFVTEKGWGVEYAIPVWFLEVYSPGFSLHPGKKLRGNFYKCAEDSVTPHFITWNKVDYYKPDFHRPEYFGQLIFK